MNGICDNAKHYFANSDNKYDDYLNKKKLLVPETEQGILFWSSMYIPVIVAMSATQNVKAALIGGWVALIVAIIATSVCFLLIPLIAKINRIKN